MASVLCNKPESTGVSLAKSHLDTSKRHHSPRVFLAVPGVAVPRGGSSFVAFQSLNVFQTLSRVCIIFLGHLDAVDSNNKFNKLGEKKMLRKIFCCLFGSAKPVAQPMENLAEKPEAGQVVVQSNDPILAQIQLFALDFAPVGWLICDGRQLAITQYMVLFALLGTKYGGDGKMSFALPDLRDKAPMPNMVYCLCVSGVFPERGGN